MIRNAYSSLARYENTSSKKSFSPDAPSVRKGVRPGDFKQRFDSLINQSYESPEQRHMKQQQRCTSAMSSSRNRHVEASYYSNSVFGGVSHYGQANHASQRTLSPPRRDPAMDSARSLHPAFSKKRIRIGRNLDERHLTLTIKDIFTIYEAKCKDLLIPFYEK